MRSNTQTLISDPRFSLVDTPTGKWAKLSTINPREMLEFSRTLGRTTNERAWQSSGSKWQGLGLQSLASLDSTGIPEHARDAMNKAIAVLNRKPSRPGRIAPTMVGGTWSVPAVLANLPLAARSRLRTRLPPLRIHLVLAWSASVDEAALTPIFAKLARSIWDYTLSGGAVDLRVSCLGFARATSTKAKGLIAESRVPCSDISQLALALSPAFFRAVTGPLMTAFSDSSSDSIMVPQPSDNPIPDSIYIGGRTRTGELPELSKVLDALSIR